MIVTLLFLAAATTAVATQRPTVLEQTTQHLALVRAAIDDTRTATHRCQDVLGIKRTRVSRVIPQSPTYAAWVLKLWKIRRAAYCAAARAIRRLTSISVTESELRRLIDPCMAEIIDRETGGTWDPTIDFGFGHGNVHEAYGLPQANPGTKMAAAGADWRTNPLTQLRWMRRYVNERYGGSCQALAHHNANGEY